MRPRPIIMRTLRDDRRQEVDAAMERRQQLAQRFPHRTGAGPKSIPTYPHRPRLAQAATLLLSSLTALALLALALAPGSPLRSGEPAPSAAPMLTRAFYAAVNTLLTDDDDASLTPLVAPAVVAHLPDGRRVTGPPALLAYWRTLGHGASGQRLALDTLLVDGDQAAATIEPIVPSAPWPDLVLLGSAASHAVTERFRIAQGRIADYWPGLDPQALPQALPPLPMPLVVGPIGARLARVELPPHAALTDLVGADPHLLLPQLGMVTVLADGPVQVAHVASPDVGWRQTAAPTTLTLHPGDAALIRGGARHTLRNDTAEATVLLGVALTPLLALANAPTAPPLLDLYRAGIDGRAIGATGITATWLAAGFDRCPTASATLRIATFVLAPGQIVAPDRVGGVTLVVGDQGVALTDHAPAPTPSPTLPASAMAAAMAAHGALDAAPQGTAPALADTVGMVAAGDGSALSMGMRGRIANAGDEPARVTLIILGPSADPLPHATAGATRPAACNEG